MPGTRTIRHWAAGTAFAWTAKRSTRRGTAAFKPPSITLNNVLGTQTLTRTVRNAGAASSTFSASASMGGYTVNVELATWRSRPARASLLARRSHARAPDNVERRHAYGAQSAASAFQTRRRWCNLAPLRRSREHRRAKQVVAARQAGASGVRVVRSNFPDNTVVASFELLDQDNHPLATMVISVETNSPAPLAAQLNRAVKAKRCL